MSTNLEPVSCARQHRRGRFRDRGGFTLIEVLVAFAVMATLMSVLFRSVVTIRSSAIAFNDHTRQNIVALAILEDVLAKRKLASGTSGGIRDGIRWRLAAMPANVGMQLPRAQTAPLQQAGGPTVGVAVPSHPAPRSAATDDRDKPQWTLQRLVVQVGAYGRPFEIETIRLVRSKTLP